jgi:ribosomal protein S18 acetylase RimI-like enzyme
LSDDALAWRAEAACRDAWPCGRETAIDGWLVCASGGVTRRTNSVNPLAGDRADIAMIVDRARAIYGAIGQPLLVRVPGIVPGLDDELDRLGFGPIEGGTITLHAVLGPAPVAAGGDVHVGALDADWLEARGLLVGWDADAMQVYARMLGLIAGPVMFASAQQGKRIVAVAYGTIQHGLLVIESVVTDAAARRCGFGRQVVGALLDWGRAQGVGEACLQVVADNDAAVALYRGLGFDRLLYPYHYRREGTRG